MNILCWLIKELIYDALLFAEYNFTFFSKQCLWGLLSEGHSCRAWNCQMHLPPLLTPHSTDGEFVCKYCLSVCFEATILLLCVLLFSCKYMQSIFADSKYINLNEILVMFISVFLKTSTLFWECALTILNDNLF